VNSRGLMRLVAYLRVSSDTRSTALGRKGLDPGAQGRGGHQAQPHRASARVEWINQGKRGVDR